MELRALTLRATAVLLGLLVPLFVAEVALRAIENRESQVRPFTTAESDFRKPDFRTPTSTAPKKPDAFRVVVLGDSYTWGYGLEPEFAYPRQLAEILGSRSDGPVEVISWSRPGWNTWEAWRTLRDELPTLDPDLVIVGYVLNDAESSFPDVRKALRRRHFDPPIGNAIVRGLDRSSAVVRALRNALASLDSRRRLKSYYEALYEGQGWTQAKRGLRQLRKASQDQSFELVLAIFPVFDSELDESYAYTGIHELIARTCRTLKISVVDLLPSFRDSDGSAMALIPFSDAHPSAAAHRLAAEALAAEINRRDLLPH